jgi:hypothetical protein
MDDRWESEVIEYGAINITGFRIVDTGKKYVKDFLEGWKRLDPSTSQGAGKELISAQAALMYDAVFVLVEAFTKIIRKKPDQFKAYTMRRGQPFNLPSNGTRALDCNTSKGWVTPWEHGDKISRYLRKVRHAAIRAIMRLVCVRVFRAERKAQSRDSLTDLCF